MNSFRRALIALSAFVSLFSAAQQPPAAAAAPNSEPVYQQLQRVGMGSEAVKLSDFVLHRDAAKFKLNGVVTFMAPVEGKVTGAVFSGDGVLTITPPLREEERTLSLLTRSNEFAERFNTAVFRFTDETYEELKKAGSAAQADGAAPSALDHSRDVLRKKLHWNLSARILQDLLSSPSGLFVAFVNGKTYNGNELFVMDPFGVTVSGEAEYSTMFFPAVAPEEVAFYTYDENKFGVWTAFHFAHEYKNGRARGNQQNSAWEIEHQKLDTTIEKNGYLRGDALTTVVSRFPGLRAVRFSLFPMLRVQSVTTADGQPLNFIQEDKREQPEYWVILPKGLIPGDSVTIHTLYEGKDAVSNQGGGNYFPVAREDWYPTDRFGKYATYELTFRIPKNMTMVATGTLLSESKDGDHNVSVWKSDVPLAVAGFNFGDFKKVEVNVPPKTLVQSFANKEVPDVVKAFRSAASGGDMPMQGAQRALMNQPTMAVGTMETTQLIKKPLAETEMSVQLYSNYFGPPSYDRIALTQQTACGFGQSWPELVFVPLCSYFDETVRHQLFRNVFTIGDINTYWKVVVPHEVAHQWWGHAVGFNSYRDQWMSEGFAQFSASLYIQLIQKNPQEFTKFWDEQRELLTVTNKEGHRPIEVGPVTVGYRLANSRAGYDIPQRLIYPKGAYILHMIRMMMWDDAKGDERFTATMKDFVESFRNRAASTEDFKATVEKHMTPAMNLSGNGTMDWFFNQYVYGTDLPRYQVNASFRKVADGAMMDLHVAQSNVPDNFIMLVPVYVELGNGRVVRLGQMRIRGNSAVDQKDLPLRGLQEVPRAAMVNYYNDVLAAK